MKRGKLVIIEGNDGSGKSTQIGELVKYFKDNGVDFATFDFPQYEKTFFGNFVAGFLNGEFGKAREINPYLASIPYAGDRWQSKDELHRNLEEGKIVVCDRYATSTAAYQVVKFEEKDRDKFLNWLDELEYKVFGIPRENLVIYLFVPFRLLQNLMSKRKKKAYLNGGKDRDQHEENVVYLRKVERMYLKLCKQRKNWVKVNSVDENGNLRSIEDIHEEIIKILKENKIL